MRRGKTLLRVLLVCVVLIALGLMQLYWASRSETVLRWAIEQIAQRVPGKLEVEGIRGSFMEPIALERIRYTTEGLSVEARQATLDWSPYQLLFNKRLWIRELRARELDIVSTPAQKAGKTSALPAHLRLPIPVRVDSLQVTRVSVQTAGTPPVVVTELALAYDGDDQVHRLQIQRLQSQWGSFTGAAQLAAQTPFATNATARFTGALAQNWPATIDLKLRGTLQTLDASWQLAARDIHVDGTARVAPFSGDPLQKLTAQAKGLDLRTLAPNAPSTAIDVTFEGAASGTSEIRGRLSAANRLPGTVDEQRLPLRSVSGTLSAKIDSLRMTDATFDLGPAGQARGEATLRADGALAQLQVTDLDLRAVHRALRRTRLAGNINATVSASGQQYAGRLVQERLSFAFAVKHTNDVLIVDSFTAQAGSATASASGKLDLGSANRFSANGALQRFDPAALGDFPGASINGTFSAEGRLRPDWQVALAYRIVSSTFRGQRLTGAGKLTVSPQHLQHADANLVVGGNRLELRGAFGKPAETLDIALDAPALKAIGPQWSGSVRGSGRITGTLASPGCDFTLTARGLTLPGGYRVDKLDATGKVERAADPRFQLQARAQDLAIEQRRLASVVVEASGSFASHDAQLQASGPKLDLETRVQGGWVSSQRHWSGRVLQLENRGEYAVKLLEPMPLTVGAERLALGPARLQFFGGRIDVAQASYERGELASSGTLSGISAAKLVSLLKAETPMETSVIIGGQWNLKAGNTANGRIELHRESGDVIAIADDERLSLGLTELAAQVDIVENRVSARLNAKAASVGSASAQAETRLERRRRNWGLPGSAPLKLSARAQVSSLKPLAALYSPNTAVDGKLAIDVRGSGTLSDPKLQGRADAEQLRIERIDAGVMLREGVLHATFANERIDVSEFSIAGGTGRLTARGTRLRARRAADLAHRLDRRSLGGRTTSRFVSRCERTRQARDRQRATRRERRADGGSRARRAAAPHRSTLERRRRHRRQQATLAARLQARQSGNRPDLGSGLRLPRARTWVGCAHARSPAFANARQCTARCQRPDLGDARDLRGVQPQARD